MDKPASPARRRVAAIKLAALMCCAAAALAGCTSQANLRKTELTVLAAQLPGNYDNPQQLLTILRLASPLVGDQVFYVRETMANDTRRVISERIWSLNVATGDRIVGAVFEFDEPDRWRNGVDSPELFRSLLLRDLRSLPGCELIWQKSPRGFTAAGASTRCPGSWLLEGDQLAFSTDGAAAAPGSGDRYFHFVRRGGTR